MINNPSRKYWNEASASPETHYLNRRHFIRQLAASSGAVMGAGLGAGSVAAALSDREKMYNIPEHALSDKLYPAKINPAYKVKRALTPKDEVFTYNNFYEFSLDKKAHRYVEPFQPFPWQIEVTGLCGKPKKWDIDEMLKAFPLEERTYRFRCVEAWAMTVPWTGFPLKSLIEKCEPDAKAKYVRFVSFHRPEQAVGQRENKDYSWPYYEGVNIEEAMNPLAFVATGLYGKQLPKQSGAPLRIVFPWKYGYKGPKSIVKIELTDQKPHTFWNDAMSKEYGYFSNVNPSKPHPRWSQSTERLLVTGQRVATRLYNGYEQELEGLHKTLYKNGEVF
ncbi:MAG: protein-methionine-sulfoxide reductase catalytic subunit MsrP [Verrucomicrobiales bacterium]|nr:protein-methionine-sulfoxide reductase catalytic subunit MsrP [Verrucomicrobiales bacterium]